MVNLLVGLIGGILTKDIVVRLSTEDGTATRKNKCHKFHIEVNNFSSRITQDYRKLLNLCSGTNVCCTCGVYTVVIKIHIAPIIT